MSIIRAAVEIKLRQLKTCEMSLAASRGLRKLRHGFYKTSYHGGKRSIVRGVSSGNAESFEKFKHRQVRRVHSF